MSLSKAKNKQFAFTLNADDLRMLHEVASSMGRSAASYLRMLIREDYAAAVQDERIPRRKARQA